MYVVEITEDLTDFNLKYDPINPDANSDYLDRCRPRSEAQLLADDPLPVPQLPQSNLAYLV